MVMRGKWAKKYTRRANTAPKGAPKGARTLHKYPSQCSLSLFFTPLSEQYQRSKI